MNNRRYWFIKAIKEQLVVMVLGGNNRIPRGCHFKRAAEFLKKSQYIDSGGRKEGHSGGLQTG